MDKTDYFKKERDKVVKGLEEAYKRLLDFKKWKNSPFVIQRNGRIVEVDPDDMPVTIKYVRKTDGENVRM